MLKLARERDRLLGRSDEKFDLVLFISARTLWCREIQRERKERGIFACEKGRTIQSSEDKLRINNSTYVVGSVSRILQVD